MNWWCASGFWNVFCELDILSQGGFCVWSFSANPKSYLLILIASWCLKKMSMYFSSNSIGTWRWYFCAMFCLDNLFLIFGNLSWISWHTKEITPSLRGISSSSLISRSAIRLPYSRADIIGCTTFNDDFGVVIFAHCDNWGHFWNHGHPWWAYVWNVSGVRILFPPNFSVDDCWGHGWKDCLFNADIVLAFAPVNFTCLVITL